jgi:hypothetical protein
MIYFLIKDIVEEENLYTKEKIIILKKVFPLLQFLNYKYSVFSKETDCCSGILPTIEFLRTFLEDIEVEDLIENRELLQLLIG